MKPAEEWARECVEGNPRWEAVGATAQEERIAKFIRAARREALEAALKALKDLYVDNSVYSRAIERLKDNA